MISWNKNKTKINLTIDAIMLLALMAIAGLGFLIKYILIPGYKRNVLYPGDVELFFMGITRHEWGRIHLLLGFIFLFLLLLHIILHWNMIGHIFRQMLSGKSIRKFIAVLFAAVCLFLLLAPLLIKPEVVSLPRRHIHSKTIDRFSENDSGKLQGNEQKAKEEIHHNQVIHEGGTERLHQHAHHEIEVFGHMTLNEVSEKYDVSLAELKKILNIPTVQSDDRIGRLKKQYGFLMSDFRNAILEIKKE